MTSKFCFSFIKIKISFISLKQFPALCQKKRTIWKHQPDMHSALIFSGVISSPNKVFLNCVGSLIYLQSYTPENKVSFFQLDTILSLWEESGWGTFMPKMAFCRLSSSTDGLFECHAFTLGSNNEHCLTEFSEDKQVCIIHQSP